MSKAMFRVSTSQQDSDGPDCCTQAPWLMLPPTNENSLCERFWLSDGISEYPTYEEKPKRFWLPQTFSGMRCLSSKGWLVIVGEDWNVSLLHPFSTLRVKLPSMRTIMNWQRLSHDVHVIYKCFISSSPVLKSDYTMIIIYGALGELAYARRGDKVWNPINGWRGCYLDITCYRGQFYAINKSGMIMACNIKDDNNSSIAQVVAQMPQERFSKLFKQSYILESAGALLVVLRVQWSCSNLQFYVFEVDLRTNTWTKIKNLGNRAIFLGHNSSFAIETSKVSYCKSNSIYFTPNSRFDHYSWLRHGNGGKMDMGIYSLKDGSIIPHYRDNSISDISPPVWLEN